MRYRFGPLVGMLGVCLAAATGVSPADARDLQSACAAALGNRAGTVVVADAHSGRLLALVHPGLAATPLPPGSVFKLVTALAALDAGVAVPLACHGRFRAADGQTRPCWKPGGHGRLTLEEALGHSCNVYFYQLGSRLGRERMLAKTRAVGLPAPANGRRWSLTDASIGEGPYFKLTPLQLAGFTASVATDGRRRSVGWPPGAPGGLIAPGEHLRRVRAGMRAGVAVGSSRQAAGGRLAIAGKTGTSTYTDGSNRTYGWFTGYAPADRPQVVVTVMLKQANGFADAAPVARKVFDAWAAR